MRRLALALLLALATPVPSIALEYVGILTYEVDGICILNCPSDAVTEEFLVGGVALADASLVFDSGQWQLTLEAHDGALSMFATIFSPGAPGSQTAEFSLGPVTTSLDRAIPFFSLASSGFLDFDLLGPDVVGVRLDVNARGLFPEAGGSDDDGSPQWAVSGGFFGALIRVPEPGTMLLFALGIAGLALRRVRARRP